MLVSVTVSKILPPTEVAWLFLSCCDHSKLHSRCLHFSFAFLSSYLGGAYIGIYFRFGVVLSRDLSLRIGAVDGCWMWESRYGVTTILKSWYDVILKVLWYPRYRCNVVFISVTFSLQNATVKQTVTNSYKPYSRTKTLNLDSTYFTNLHRRSILGMHGLSDITAQPPSPPFGLGLLCGFPNLPTINTHTHSTLSSLVSPYTFWSCLCSTLRMYIFISTSMSFLHYLDNTHTRLCIYASQIPDTICNYCRLYCFSCPITSPGDNL